MIFAPTIAALISLLFYGTTLRGLTPQRVHIFWAAFAGSIFCFTLITTFGERLGILFLPIAIAGTASCGWSWMLARALFRPPLPDARWPLVIVASIMVTGAVSYLTTDLTPAAQAAQPLLRMLDNVHMLASSTVLILAPVEALHGYTRDLPLKERRFREVFVMGYLALFAISVLWVRQSADGTAAAEWGDVAKICCALVALWGAGLAVRFRERNPLAPVPSTERRARPGMASPADPRLAERIMRLVTEKEIYRTPDLKLADLAHEVGGADYRVTQCITRVLGFRNFNHLINHFRVEHAKRMLADPQQDDRSILSIAMEAGFGSIGPFNRAFKDEVGSTPRAFRAGRETPLATNEDGERGS